MKYHLGACIERVNRTTNKDIKISIVANPSHLEGWVNSTYSVHCIVYMYITVHVLYML